MAEGFLRHLSAGRFEVASAGTEATGVRRETVEAMRRYGIDIAGQTSETLDRYLDQPWDYVITVCDQANESCPFFPGAAQRLHWSFEDPSRVRGPERQAAFDRGAAEIRQRIEEWLGSMAR
jgi:arsenate reductase (thioredoxin)